MPKRDLGYKKVIPLIVIGHSDAKGRKCHLFKDKDISIMFCNNMNELFFQKKITLQGYNESTVMK